MGAVIGKKKTQENGIVGIAKGRGAKKDLDSSDSSGDSSSLAPSVSQGSSYQSSIRESANRSQSKSGESSIDDIELQSHPSNEIKAMNSAGSVNLKDDDSENSGDSTKPMQVGGGKSGKKK